MPNMDTNTTTNSTKENFMINLIETLNNENIKRINNNREIIDVCHLTSVVDLQIEKCQEFLNDISNHEYDIEYQYNEEDYVSNYKNGKVKINIRKTDEEKENNNNNMYNVYHNYCYYIHFSFDLVSSSYTFTDEGYNGQECNDWSIPSFSIDKIIKLGEYIWQGNEKDYLEYEKQFELNSKNKNEELETLKLEKDKQELRDEIKMLQEKLMLLEGGM